jgi:hypothetical protein
MEVKQNQRATTIEIGQLKIFNFQFVLCYDGRQEGLRYVKFPLPSSKFRVKVVARF